MRIRKYVILEKTAKLYLGKRILYGYNAFNQTIYKVYFHSNMNDVMFFRTVAAANQFIDSLPPTENIVHICTDTHGNQLKLSNLKVMPIKFSYDS